MSDDHDELVSPVKETPSDVVSKELNNLDIRSITSNPSRPGCTIV